MTSIFLKINAFLSNKLWLLALLILTVLSLGALALMNLNLEEDISNVLPKDGELAKYEHLIEKSSTGNKLIFILKSEDKDVDQLVAAGNNLQSILQESIPDSLVAGYNIVNDESVFLELLDGIYGNLPLYLNNEDLQGINLDENALREKIQKKLKVLFTPAGSMMKQSITHDPLDLSIIALKKLQSLQVDNNFDIVNSCLISKDSTYLLGFVKLTDKVNLKNQKHLLQSSISATVEQLNKESSIKHNVFGASIISEENALRIKKDIMLTVNLAVAILMIGLMLYYRSFKVLPGFILPIALGASVALFLLYLNQSLVSAISLGMGSVLLGTIIDYSLHILTHLKKSGNAEDSIKHTAAPIMAGSITTATAFLCLLFIQSKALTDLALFAAFSMLFGAIFAIIVLPILYKKTFQSIDYKETFIDKFIAFPFHRNKFLVIFCVIVVFVSIFFVNKVSFTKDLNELNYMPGYIAEAEEELQKASNALQSSLIVIVEKPSLNEAIQTTEQIEIALQEDLQSKQIADIKSATGVLSSEEKNQERLANWKAFWTKDKVSLVEKILFQEADKLGINQDAFDPFLSQLTGNYIAHNSDNLGLAENYISHNQQDGTYLSTLIIKLSKDNKSLISEKIKSLDPSISVIDKSSMITVLVNQVKSSLTSISWLLLGLILLILFLYFRNLELVILAFIPVFLSWITTLGLMGMFKVPFNMLNIIIVIFIFGLGIDYAIFILSALVDDYRTGSKQFNTVKSSVLLSAFTTFVGISVLIFAKHPALNSIATAGMTAILSVFIYAIIILPALFYFLVYHRTKDKFEPTLIRSLYDMIYSYALLVLGVFMITFVGMILHLLLFIPMQKRKLFFHKVFNYWARHYIKLIFPKSRNFYSNESNEDFSQPAIVIANHQSLLDTPILVGLAVKTIVLTKSWVRNSPLFGLGARLADFYSVDDGFEETIQNLKEKVKDNFSIALFPEGTRTTDRSLLRFYRGAFMLAQELELDIVPVMIHGTSDTCHKNSFLGQRRQLHLTILKRIKFSDKSFGETGPERYKLIRNFYKENYASRQKEVETGNYFQMQAISNYSYKGYEILKEIKKTLKQFNNFEDLTDMFQNEKTTLIIDESKGVLTVMQNLVNSKKEITILSSQSILIQQCYNALETNIYLDSFESISKEYEQVIYIGKGTLASDKIEKVVASTTKFISLELK